MNLEARGGTGPPRLDRIVLHRGTLKDKKLDLKEKKKKKRWQPPRRLQCLRQVDLEQFLLTRVLLQPTTLHTRRVGTGRWLLLVRWRV
jgi:hypothetical protein